MRFKIDWVSLIVGSKFTVFACFTLHLRAYIFVNILYFVGRFNGGFFAYEFGVLIFGGAYFRNFVVMVQFLSLLLFEDTGISTIRQLRT